MEYSCKIYRKLFFYVEREQNYVYFNLTAIIQLDSFFG